LKRGAQKGRRPFNDSVRFHPKKPVIWHVGPGLAFQPDGKRGMGHKKWMGVSTRNKKHQKASAKDGFSGWEKSGGELEKRRALNGRMKQYAPRGGNSGLKEGTMIKKTGEWVPQSLM